MRRGDGSGGGDQAAGVSGGDGLRRGGGVSGGDAGVVAASGLRVVDPWEAARAFTPARVGLGRSGDAITTKDQLALRLAHAQARDAVHTALDVDAIRAELDGQPVVAVRSAAPDRTTYLQRPDLGRRLADGEAERLSVSRAAVGLGSSSGSSSGAVVGLGSSPEPGSDSNVVAGSDSAVEGSAVAGPDVVFVLADGLSPLAVQRHAAATLLAASMQLADWSIGPVVVATQARVALGDEIGAALGARFVVVLIGERPGLSAADSLGIYFTYAPKPGLPDSARNCISNVRPPVGLTYEDAATKLATMLREADRLGLTGVGLKDDAPALDA